MVAKAGDMVQVRSYQSDDVNSKVKVVLDLIKVKGISLLLNVKKTLKWYLNSFCSPYNVDPKRNLKEDHRSYP